MTRDESNEGLDALIVQAEEHLKNGDFTRCRDAAERAAALARQLNRPDLLARAALAHGHVMSLRQAPGRGPGTLLEEQSAELIEEALAALPREDSELRASVLSRLAWIYYYLRQPDDLRAQLSHEAVAMATRLGNVRTRLSVLYERHVALTTPHYSRTRIAVAHEMVQLARENDEIEFLAQAYQLRAWDFAEVGDIRAADADMDAYAKLAEEIRQPMLHWTVLVWRSMRAALEGRFAEAQTLAFESLELGRLYKDDISLLTFHTIMGGIAVAQSTTAGSPEAIQLYAQQYPTMAVVQSVVAHWLAESGKLAESSDLAEALMPALMQPARNSTWLIEATVLSDVFVTLRNRTRCRQLYDLLLPFADLNGILGTYAAAYGGSIARVLGTLATMINRYNDGDRYFRIAAQKERAIGALPSLARTWTDHVTLLLARNAPGDKTTAKRMLDEARAYAESFAMPGLLRKIEQRRAGL